MPFPRMSATEREALAAGTVWIERELFSGRPRFRRSREAEAARLDALAVDSFALEDYLNLPKESLLCADVTP